MKKQLAHLTLYSGANKRSTPFQTGYRPLFKLGNAGLTSGMITLLDRAALSPGERAVVEIRFLEAEINEGDQFYFYEALEPLGECVVLQILAD